MGDLHIDQIWNSHPLHLDLFLLFCYTHKRKLRPKEVKWSCLGHSASWGSFESGACLPFGHTAPSVYPPRDRALHPPTPTSPSLPYFGSSLLLQMFVFMFVSPHWRIFSIDFEVGWEHGWRHRERGTSMWNRHLDWFLLHMPLPQTFNPSFIQRLTL